MGMYTKYWFSADIIAIAVIKWVCFTLMIIPWHIKSFLLQKIVNLYWDKNINCELYFPSLNLFNLEVPYWFISYLVYSILTSITKTLK